MSAKKDTENSANVARLHSDYVMASVLKINMSIKLIKYIAILVLFLSYLEQIF